MESIGEERTCQLTAQLPNVSISLHICLYCVASSIVGMGGGGAGCNWRVEEEGGTHQLTLQLTAYRIHTSSLSLFTTGTDK